MRKALTSGFWLLTTFFAFGASAASWAPPTEAERRLKEVGGFPEAPAVVLSRDGYLSIDERNVSSYLEVHTRIKILREEGRSYGTVEILGSDFLRMRDLEGRTLQADGRSVALTKDAKFEKKYSLYYRQTVHSFAMPEVQVGSIVEYRYRLFFDSPLFARYWYFQSELPVLRSRMVCEFPETFGFQPYRISTAGEMPETVKRSPKGYRVTYSMEKLPPIPEEPAAFPFHDLASRVLFLPSAQVISGYRQPLLESWKSTVDIFQGFDSTMGYRRVRKADGSARRRARQLVEGLAERRQKIAAVYRFVRDEIRLEPYSGVGAGERTLDKVLSNGRGDYAEQALLLQAMLKGVKVKSSLGWVGSRELRRVDPSIPDPAQFDRVLVVTELDGERLFLDPSDEALAFGQLPPELEGVPCLLVDAKSPEFVTTPASKAEDSQREIHLRLALDDEGRLTGEGRGEMTGHHAWRWIRWQRTEEETVEAWREWLEGRLRSFDVTAVEVDQGQEERRVTVRWRLALRPEEVLGDEVSVLPAVPLAVKSNPFTLPVERRVSPVMFRFPDTDLVRVQLTWPAGWSLDAEPRLRSLANAAGTLSTEMVLEPAERSAMLERRFEIPKRAFFGRDAYRDLQRLYAEVVANDAEELVLIRE